MDDYLGRHSFPRVPKNNTDNDNNLVMDVTSGTDVTTMSIHNVNTLHTNDSTWLTRAILTNCLQAANDILRLGANCNITSKVYDNERRIFRWETPLITAARMGYIGMARVLVDHGASLDVRESSTGRSAVHWACTRKHDAIVTYLIQAGAAVNDTNVDGETPIVEAIVNRNMDLIQLFLGSDIFLDTPINYDRDTALMLCVHIGMLGAAERFLKAGAEVNWFNRDHEDVLQILLRDYTLHVDNLLEHRVLYMILLSGAQIRTIHLTYCRKSDYHYQVLNLLQSFHKKPVSLMNTCRAAIRQRFLDVTKGKAILNRINSLQIPKYIKQFLAFEIL